MTIRCPKVASNMSQCCSNIANLVFLDHNHLFFLSKKVTDRRGTIKPTRTPFTIFFGGKLTKYANWYLASSRLVTVLWLWVTIWWGVSSRKMQYDNRWSKQQCSHLYSMADLIWILSILFKETLCQFPLNRSETNRIGTLVGWLHVLFVSGRLDENWRSVFFLDTAYFFSQYPFWGYGFTLSYNLETEAWVQVMHITCFFQHEY